MNSSSEAEAIEDYRRVFDRLSPFADYVVVNVSCPNTPDEFDEASPTTSGRSSRRSRPKTIGTSRYW